MILPPKRDGSGRGARITRRFSSPVLKAIDQSQILGIRAGARSEHRFIGIWAVVVGGRVVARSWTLKPGGWYRTLLEEGDNNSCEAE